MWLEDLVKRNQSLEDNVHLPRKIANYKLASENWVKANTINQQAGLPISPKPVKPTTFTYTIVNGEQVETEVPVVGLVDPVLPPVTPTGPVSEVFVTQGDERDNIIIGLLQAILKKVNSLS